MAFGLNMAQLIGRLGDDVSIHHLPSGGRVANMSRGDRRERTSIARAASAGTGPSGTRS